MSGSVNGCRRVLFSGTVQGVGFRYTTQSIARRFPVAGYVKNLRDGRVEVIVEGAEAEIDRFVGAVRQQMAEYIHGFESADEPATGRFDGFQVRF